MDVKEWGGSEKEKKGPQDLVRLSWIFFCEKVHPFFDNFSYHLHSSPKLAKTGKIESEYENASESQKRV